MTVDQNHIRSTIIFNIYAVLTIELASFSLGILQYSFKLFPLLFVDIKGPFLMRCSNESFAMCSINIWIPRHEADNSYSAEA
jgi:hypothetical protein